MTIGTVVAGGPAKVMEHYHTVFFAGAAQGSFVMLPVVFPLIFIWWRSAYQNPNASRYVIEHGLFELETLQIVIFCLATSLIICAMVENALYLVLGLTMPKPEPPTPDDDDDDDDDDDGGGGGGGEVSGSIKKDSACVKRLWAIKGASAYLWKLFLLIHMIISLGFLVLFVVVIVVAITVDPFRPLAVLVRSFPRVPRRFL